MKTQIVSVVGGLTLALVALACDNSKLPTINNDPNNPTDAPAGAVFTYAAQLATHWVGNGRDLRATEFVTQHLAEAQYPDEDRYNRLQGPSTTAYFDDAYFQELQDLRKVIEKGETANDPTIWGPATVMQVWTYEYLTDIWGNIPYSEALTADSDGGTLTPTYDKQQDIYNSFFTRLTAASAAMQGAEGSLKGLGSADPIYGDDMAQWAKFANSLRARLAMRIVNVDPATAGAQLTAAFTDPGGVFGSNLDNAAMPWPGDGVYDNGWADNFKTRDDHRMSQTLMNEMVPYDDPRVPVYAQPVQDDSIFPGGYGGMPNGLNTAAAGFWIPLASRPGLIFYPGATSYGTFGSSAGLSQPSYLMTYAEVMFIKAEAAARGMGALSPGDAGADYDSAIVASMAQWGVTNTAAINAFLAKPAIAYAGGTPGLVQIATQKWVALFTDGTQAWAEWRRTCVPVTAKAGPDAIVNFIPRRFEYSQTEYEVNKPNVMAALTDMGGPDTFATHMWWDSNVTAAPTYTAACNTP